MILGYDSDADGIRLRFGCPPKLALHWCYSQKKAFWPLQHETSKFLNEHINAHRHHMQTPFEICCSSQGVQITAVKLAIPAKILKVLQIFCIIDTQTKRIWEYIFLFPWHRGDCDVLLQSCQGKWWKWPPAAVSLPSKWLRCPEKRRLTMVCNNSRRLTMACSKSRTEKTN